MAFDTVATTHSNPSPCLLSLGSAPPAVPRCAACMLLLVSLLMETKYSYELHRTLLLVWLERHNP